MQTFLGQVADQIIATHKNDLGEVTIVLPSRRAKVFLLKQFQQKLEQSSWLPEIYSLEDFIQKLGNYQILDRIDLIFELYAIHKELEGSKAESLEDFMSWGSILLQDFNEIDRYCIDSKDLYTFLSEARALETWNLDKQELTDFQLNYLQFWRKLGDYYQAFQKRLASRQQAYQGMAFRKTAELAEKGKLNLSQGQQLYLAGFNAFSVAESKILKACEDFCKTQFIWDADQYYLDDFNQEAGKFLRKEKLHQKEFKQVSDLLLSDDKEVDIYAISGDVGQAKLVGELLEKSPANDLQNTAVILSDEGLLLPVLEALPQKIERVNVTMGYPLSQTVFYQFFSSYIKLFYHLEKSEESKGFYFQDLQHFLKQVPLQFLNPSIKEKIKTVTAEINQKKLIEVNESKLTELSNALGFQAFSLANNLNQLVENLRNWCLLFKDESKAIIDEVQNEFLFGFYKQFNRLLELSKSHQSLKTVEGLWQLFRQLLEQESTAFVGEPLSGLQLMGVLESRTLDFEHLIISSVNEGILPAGKSQNSFIPFDIKQKFGLPSYKEKDAIFAYHFYRILQRAKKIDLIYNTKIDQLKGGEPSRFIEQLRYEWPKKNPKVELKHHTISPKLLDQKDTMLKINKSEDIVEKIKAHLSKGLSASALNTFLSCPLDYYYRYILKLKEEELVQEGIEDSSFGEIVHNCLEQLYKPYVGQLLDAKSIASINEQLENELRQQFQEVLKINPKTGSLRLAFEVAKRYVKDVIKIDEAEIKSKNEIHILGLEQAFEKKLEVEGLEFPVKLKGIIDRIDKRNGQKRIIDYKSGKVISTDVNFRDVESLLNGNKPKAVQLILYGLAIDEEVDLGILSLKNLKSGLIQMKRSNFKTEAAEFLSMAVSKLLDTEQPFAHNEKAQYCTFCEA